ncbi:unnamed protein product [Rotaria magnacalcarata]|uniref:ABC transporter domain-containing protein n=1 Tax=Rotaria magnacalcarata TaxID=392030 RepID=A0A816Q6N3_9BILA|nr:unnamed protein product [Rotaria magnacalcarata]CAF2057835.1 unnamed protein product [Rotaria magnacalcarata]CAF3824843.1 unnamed protein product [Rotaria magnacalcarata]CAF3871982.1 unnamed protein product [Rotaria magnacalcarata]
MTNNNRVTPTTITLEIDEGVRTNQNSTLTFKSINYFIHGQKCCNLCLVPCLQKTQKQILTNLSGIFRTGMNAIMGPTGCGKSSLLDLLADRKDRQGFEGEILLNGQIRTHNYKSHVGYVVQDDIVCGNLTVKENLMFSANVRLSTEYSTIEKSKTVDDVIVQLGLEKCADTVVGTEFKRGVSGGERKRTNIGMELVLSPRILFLDEPTTGLDSSMARSVMECLHQLSRTGCTIVFSIHQPRYSIFKLFDTLFLLSAGRCTYHGPTDSVLNFFSSVGFLCEEHNNPADFLLDITQGDRPPPSAQQQDDVEFSKERKRIEVFFNEEYMKTDMYKSIQKDIPEKVDLLNGYSYMNDVRLRKKSRSNDMYYVCQRTLRNSFRDSALFILQVVISIILGLLIGLIYLNIDNTTTTGVKNRTGAIFFIIANQVFSNLSALEAFIKERPLFVHENASGYYHVLTYFLAKVLCDIIPLRTIPAIVFSIVSYFMMGLQRTAEKFFMFFFFIWLTSICASTLCFLVSATVRNFGVANLVAGLFYVLTLIFSGFLVEISSVVVFLRWIQYFSIFRYGINALSVNEFMGLTFCYSTNLTVCTETGADVLSGFNIDHGTDWDLWKNCVALSVITVGFLILTYVQLRRMKKTK